MAEDTKSKIQAYLEDLLKKVNEKHEFLVHEKFLKEHQSTTLSQICSVPEHAQYKEMLDTCQITAGDDNVLIDGIYNETIQKINGFITSLSTMSDDEMRDGGEKIVNDAHAIYALYRDENEKVQQKVTEMVNNLYRVRDQIYANQLLDYIKKAF
jgi:hypothetical protein